MKVSYTISLACSVLSSCGFLVTGTEVENEIKVSVVGEAQTNMALSRMGLELRDQQGTLIDTTHTDSLGNFRFPVHKIQTFSWLQVVSPDHGLKSWFNTGIDTLKQVPVDGISTALAAKLIPGPAYRHLSDSLQKLWFGPGYLDSSWHATAGGSLRLRQALATALWTTAGAESPKWLDSSTHKSNVLQWSVFQSALLKAFTSQGYDLKQSAQVFQNLDSSGTIDSWQSELKVVDPNSDLMRLDSMTLQQLNSETQELLEKSLFYAQEAILANSGQNVSSTFLIQFKDSVIQSLLPDLKLMNTAPKTLPLQNWVMGRSKSLGLMFGVLDSSEWFGSKWTTIRKQIQANEFGDYNLFLDTSGGGVLLGTQLMNKTSADWLVKIQALDDVNSPLLYWKP